MDNRGSFTPGVLHIVNLKGGLTSVWVHVFDIKTKHLFVMLMVPTYFVVLGVNNAFQNSLQVVLVAVLLGWLEEFCSPHHRHCHDLFRGLPTESCFQCPGYNLLQPLGIICVYLRRLLSILSMKKATTARMSSQACSPRKDRTEPAALKI